MGPPQLYDLLWTPCVRLIDHRDTQKSAIFNGFGWVENIKFLPQTPQTSENLNKIYKDIELTKKNGYSFDNEENENGIICFGANIKDETSYPIASVSVSIPTFRLKKDKSTYWKPLLSKCNEISKSLGYIEKENN